MRRIAQTRDRVALAQFFRRDAALHLYELGDLDPFFFPRCTWHALFDDESIVAVVLEYGCPLLHTVLALGNDDAVKELFERVLPALPARFYAHLSPGLEPLLGARTRTAHGVHDKMLLVDRAALDGGDDGIARLGVRDLASLRDLYARAYPDNWFDPRMLETGRYFGIVDQGELIAAAGVHVYAPATKVAALGNVATDPRHRGRGHARRVVACLCRDLLRDTDVIGLNVASDNAAAIACYQRLGFVRVATYEEWLVGEHESRFR